MARHQTNFHWAIEFARSRCRLRRRDRDRRRGRLQLPEERRHSHPFPGRAACRLLLRHRLPCKLGRASEQEIRPGAAGRRRPPGGAGTGAAAAGRGVGR